MSLKYNKGDKVTVVSVEHPYERALGNTGIIADVYDGEYPYAIEYDNEELELEAQNGWLQDCFNANQLEPYFNNPVDTDLEHIPVEEEIEVKIRDLVKLIDELPQSRATSMIKTKLDEARLWLGEIRR